MLTRRRTAVATAAAFAAAALVALAAGSAAATPAAPSAAAAPAAAAAAEAAPEAAFLARLQGVCRVWHAKLFKAPLPTAIGPAATIISAADAVLPLLKSELAAIAKLKPPSSIGLRVQLTLKDGAEEVAALTSVRDAARAGNLVQAKSAFREYLAAQASVLERGISLGATC